MNDFTQMWLVNSIDDVNKLLSVGWKFIEVVYEAHELTAPGWLSIKTVGSSRIPNYLMGKPSSVLKRLKADSHYNCEPISDYMERAKGEKKE